MNAFFATVKDLPPWAQRVVTGVVAAGLALLAYKIPSVAPVALPAAMGLLGWLTPHTADLTKLARAKQPTPADILAPAPSDTPPF